MSFTFSQTQGDGVTLSYTIVAKGGYFEEEDIVVELIDIETGEAIEQVLDTDYTISDSTVTFTTAPTSSYYVRIRRSVDTETTYSDFTRGNAFGADNLNNSLLKNLYQVQQIADGFLPDDYYLKADLNAGTRKITNLAEGENDEDAVTLSQMQDAIADISGTGEVWKIEDGYLYIYVE